MTLLRSVIHLIFIVFSQFFSANLTVGIYIVISNVAHKSGRNIFLEKFGVVCFVFKLGKIKTVLKAIYIRYWLNFKFTLHTQF